MNASVDPIPASRGATILVVDDEPDIVEAVQELLETGLPNVRVRTAASGLEGLRLLAVDPVDLIISDFKMPGMDGLEFLARCQRLAPEVPQILMTAFVAEVPDVARGRLASQRFLGKPFRVAEVLSAVRGALHGTN